MTAITNDQTNGHGAKGKPPGSWQPEPPPSAPQANRAQAARNETPPIGVTAPSQRSPVSAIVYRLPENKTIPVSIKANQRFNFPFESAIP